MCLSSSGLSMDKIRGFWGKSVESLFRGNECVEWGKSLFGEMNESKDLLREKFEIV